jgi:hypothetical protein
MLGVRENVATGTTGVRVGDVWIAANPLTCTSVNPQWGVVLYVGVDVGVGVWEPATNGAMGLCKPVVGPLFLPWQAVINEATTTTKNIAIPNCTIVFGLLIPAPLSFEHIVYHV